ncbi:hypothetical protein GE061_002848 [Apolygus lucorum]|uniref:FP protein C-terminal domain-containing protein n=1 Tax=Apolygus lucorum TaxID=248454 RepID=A0A8S9X8W4_APOLU|nr:hypothetical protein GE061_002848 [Apolygus lucorum]
MTATGPFEKRECPLSKNMKCAFAPPVCPANPPLEDECYWPKIQGVLDQGGCKVKANPMASMAARCCKVQNAQMQTSGQRSYPPPNCAELPPCVRCSFGHPKEKDKPKKKSKKSKESDISTLPQKDEDAKQFASPDGPPFQSKKNCSSEVGKKTLKSRSFIFEEAKVKTVPDQTEIVGTTEDVKVQKSRSRSKKIKTIDTIATAPEKREEIFRKAVYDKEDYIYMKSNDKSFCCEPCSKARRRSRVVGDDSLSGSSPHSKPVSEIVGSDDGSAEQRKQSSKGDSLAMFELLEELRDEIKRSKLSLSAQIDGVNSEVTEVKNNLEKYWENISENTKGIADIKSELRDLNATIETVKGKYDATNKRVSELEEKVNSMEQQLKGNCVEIVGLPNAGNEQNPENVLALVCALFKAIGMDVSEKEISYRQRPPAHVNMPGVIIVEFVRKIDKNELFVTLRRLTAPLTTRVLDKKIVEPTNIYINHSLTYNNRKLLKFAKDFKKEHNYRFVWMKNGRVYLKEKDERTSPAILVSSGEVLRDLAKKKEVSSNGRTGRNGNNK